MNLRYFNRDLSWLEFNKRVLYQAQDESTPLLERVRFLSIFSNNLDEFFMKRIGYLKRMEAKGVQSLKDQGETVSEILGEVRKTVIKLIEERDECYTKEILPALRSEGIFLLIYEDLTKSEKQELKNYFHHMVFPVLTPLATDPAHPFPFLSNLSVSLGVKLKQPNSEESLFARIKIPDVLPQWVLLNRVPAEGSKSHVFVRLEDLVKNNLDELFPEMVIEGVFPFRVTRNADISQQKDEDVDDLIDIVEEELRLRRMADIVRLEYRGKQEEWISNLLMEELDLEAEDFYKNKGELSYGGLNEIASLPIPRLKFSSWVPVTPIRFSDENLDIFKVIREKDVLVSHPYESFSSSVERFIQAAVEDSNVLAIKMTLYRTGDSSPLIPLLIKAAEKGKQVVCVVEVKARFDEARNIYWSEMLEKVGVHVVYGLVGLKTHCKLALVVRREKDQFQFYSHIGTGNYNANTAKLYTDYGLFTCASETSSEIIEIFNYLTGLSLRKSYEQFLVSPINMRSRFIELIQREIKNAKKGKPACIIAKMNSLEDREICDFLYEASREGVEVKLIVRGFCVLVPGEKNLSENIEVRSVIGRFLEHSRVYYFLNGEKEKAEGRFFIGSADWMYRNLNNRVETVVEVKDLGAKQLIWRDLSEILADTAQSWVLQPDGSYRLKGEGNKKESSSQKVQEQFMERFRKRNAGETA